MYGCGCGYVVYLFRYVCIMCLPVLVCSIEAVLNFNASSYTVREADGKVVIPIVATVSNDGTFQDGFIVRATVNTIDGSATGEWRNVDHTSPLTFCTHHYSCHILHPMPHPSHTTPLTPYTPLTHHTLHPMHTPHTPHPFTPHQVIHLKVSSPCLSY